MNSFEYNITFDGFPGAASLNSCITSNKGELNNTALISDNAQVVILPVLKELGWFIFDMSLTDCYLVTSDAKQSIVAARILQFENKNPPRVAAWSSDRKIFCVATRTRVHLYQVWNI